MTRDFLIRRATAQDIAVLVDLRLKMQQETGHLTKMLAETPGCHAGVPT